MSADLGDSDEGRIKAALAPFGWTCTDTFWQQYYADPWVFNLANAVDQLTQRIHELEAGETS